MNDVGVTINRCDHKTFINVIKIVVDLLERINKRRTAIGMLIQRTIVDLEPTIYFLNDLVKQSEHRPSDS